MKRIIYNTLQLKSASTIAKKTPQKKQLSPFQINIIHLNDDAAAKAERVENSVPSITLARCHYYPVSIAKLFYLKIKKISGTKSAFSSILNPCGCTGWTPVMMRKEMK